MWTPTPQRQNPCNIQGVCRNTFRSQRVSQRSVIQTTDRGRATMAHIRQPRPGFGLSFRYRKLRAKVVQQTRFTRKPTTDVDDSVPAPLKVPGRRRRRSRGCRRTSRGWSPTCPAPSSAPFTTRRTSAHTLKHAASVASRFGG